MMSTSANSAYSTSCMEQGNTGCSGCDVICKHTELTMRFPLLSIVPIFFLAHAYRVLSYRSNHSQIGATAEPGIGTATGCPTECTCSLSTSYISCYDVKAIPDFSDIPPSEKGQYRILEIHDGDLGAVDFDDIYLHLPNLTEVDMGECGITDVRNLCHTGNSDETHLRCLILDNNNLTALPQTIISCQSLEDVSMQGNFISPSGLGQQLLISLKILQRLDLSHNNISSIESESLALTSTNLRGIHLERNLLTKIDRRSGLEDVCKRAYEEDLTTPSIFLSTGNMFVCDRDLSWVCSYPSCFGDLFFDNDTWCSNQNTSIAEYCNSISVGFIWSTWRIIVTIFGVLAGVILLSFLIVFVARRYKKRRRADMVINVREGDALVQPGPPPGYYARRSSSQNTPF